MRKLSTLSLGVILMLPWLAGCNSGDTGPSKEQTVTAPNPTSVGNGGRGNPIFQNPGSSEPLPGTGGATQDNGLIGRTGPALPAIDWDHPPADMILVTVHFEFDQFNIRSEDRPLIEAAAKKLAADPTIQVVAVGHCDHFGSEQYNLALSDRRANSVKGYLINNGASDSQIQILARGKFGAVPDVGKNSPEAKNDRRVDVVMIPPGATLPSGPPPSAVTAVTPTNP